MNIILLSGWAESGKDTCADYLGKYGYKRFAFGDVLKEECAKLHGFPLSLTHTHEGKAVLHMGKSIRHHLIDYANSELAKNTYIFAEEVAINIQISNPKKIVISDWRRMDELIGLQQCLPNAKIIPIHIQRHLVSPIPHITEYQLSFPFRYRIENYGSLQEFYDAIDSIYNSL